MPNAESSFWDDVMCDAPTQPSDLPKNMTSEEQALYKRLRSVISEWKSLGVEEE